MTDFSKKKSPLEPVIGQPSAEYGHFFFLIPSTRLAYSRYHWFPLLHPPLTVPCGIALERTRYLFKCLCRFNFQPLYGGEHIFIAICLMIDACSHLLFRDAVGEGNSNHTFDVSYLCSFASPLVSCCSCIILCRQENRNVIILVNF